MKPIIAMLTAIVIVSILMLLGWWRATVWKHRYEFAMGIKRFRSMGDMSHVYWGRKE